MNGPAQRRRACLVLGALVLASAPLGAAGDESLHTVWAITGARIVTMAGPAIERGTVVIRNGLIEAVGASAAVPADADVMDGDNLVVVPGFIDALSEAVLKLPERPGPPSQSATPTDEQRGLTPDRHAWEYTALGKATLAKHHAVGVTTVLAAPSAGILPGHAALLVLSGEDKIEAVLLRDAALAVTFTPGSGYPNSLMGVMAFLRQEFLDAARYSAHTARWAADPRGVPRPPFHRRFDILAHAVEGSLPVLFFCRNQHDIRRALALRAEFRLAAVVADVGGEAFRILPEVRRAGVPVLVSVTYKAPATSVWSQQGEAERQRAERDVYPANARRLAEAGVQFAFTSWGTDSPEAFIAGVRTAIEAGLPAERALRALTTDAAAILGAGRLVGTIEEGKIANLVVYEGEPLARESKVRFVFADGRRFATKERKLKDADAPTVNVTGRWELTVERGMGAGTTSMVTFAQEESSLSGTYSTSRGTVEFTDGEVAGNQIAFEVSLSFAGRAIDIFVSGTVVGDVMHGTITTGRGSNPFTARRVP